MKKLFYIFLMVLAACLPGKAGASQCTGALAVSVTASPVAFGNYDASMGDTTSNGTIAVACASLIGSPSLPPFTITLSAGNGSFAQRQMDFLAQKLNYNFYTSAAYTTVWGDGTGGTGTQSYSGSASSTSFTVYGKIPKGQFLAVGLYTDSVTVTVTY